MRKQLTLKELLNRTVIDTNVLRKYYDNMVRIAKYEKEYFEKTQREKIEYEEMLERLKNYSYRQKEDDEGCAAWKSIPTVIYK